MLHRHYAHLGARAQALRESCGGPPRRSWSCFSTLAILSSHRRVQTATAAASVANTDSGSNNSSRPFRDRYQPSPSKTTAWTVYV
jgi:hypothetical protein